MLELIQKEMDEARRRVEVDEFGDFSRSRYGRKPPTNEFLMQREPKLFTVDEKTLGRDETRHGFMQAEPKKRTFAFFGKKFSKIA
jgi:hypothetical protein